MRLDLLDISFILLQLLNQYWNKLAIIFHNTIINLFKYRRLGIIINSTHYLSTNETNYMLQFTGKSNALYTDLG